MKNQGQKGFTLLEVSIATAIAALGIMATLQMRAAQTQIDAARSVAQIYDRLNNAAGSYMTLYYKEIIDKAMVNPGCGKSAYQIRTKIQSDLIDHGKNCKIDLTVNGQTHTVNNYLQPKPSELANLGLLTGNDKGYEDQLPLPSFVIASGSASTNMVAYNASNDSSFGTFDAQARNGMAILIQLMCIGANPAVTSPIESLDTCSTNKYDLRSLVFNIQPYTNLGDGNTLLYRVMEAAGAGRTYLSDTRFNGKLISDGGVSTLGNPVTIQSLGKLPGKSDGAPFILAIRNGYGSAGLDVFVRRDGSKTLTSDWGVGGASITGVNTVAANNVAANYVGTNEILTNSATVRENLNAGSVYGTSVTGATGVFGSFLGDVRAALNATSAYFSGNVTTDGELTVAGTTKLKSGLNVTGASLLSSDLTVSGASSLKSNLTVAGATKLSGGTKVGDFRLENEAVLGGACISSTQTLARAASTSSDYANSLRLLVCDPGTNTWVRPQKDYKDAINDTKNDLNVVSQSVDKNAGDINKLTDRVAKVEGEYMTWDFINVTWSKAKSGSSTSYVWKKTPFQCTNIGGNVDGSGEGLPVYDGEVGVRWKKYASDVQKGVAGASYTPPVFIGFDNTPEEEVVYDVNCENGQWYVGISTKASNIAGGNTCRDGLIRPSLTGKTCEQQPFNLLTPSFNKQVMSARFIAFTRK